MEPRKDGTGADYYNCYDFDELVTSLSPIFPRAGSYAFSPDYNDYLPVAGLRVKLNKMGFSQRLSK